MLLLAHQITGALLLLFHSLFLFRAWRLLKRGGSPAPADRFFMSLSQILLPVMILSGLPLPVQGVEGAALHMIPAVMPVVMMLKFSRKSFRKKHPLLLPLINGVWIAAASVTGLML